MKTKLIAACIMMGSLMAAPLVYAGEKNASPDYPSNSPAAGDPVSPPQEMSMRPEAYPMLNWNKTHPPKAEPMLAAKVRMALQDHKINGATGIWVDSNDRGVVSLEGSVPSQAAADFAVQVAKQTPGVTSVRNVLQVPDTAGG